MVWRLMFDRLCGAGPIMVVEPIFVIERTLFEPL
jgi:hypothetical protein